jgi:hypothetical protein
MALPRVQNRPPGRRGLAACVLAMVAVGTSGTLRAAPEASRPSEEQAANVEPGARPADSAANLSARQQQIADDFQHLQAVLLRMAELTAAADPHRAAILRKAISQSEERLVGAQFRTLVKLLEEGSFGRSIENQDLLLKDLEAIAELLTSEDRARRVASEKARIREYLKRTSEIIKQQKGVQGRTIGGDDPKSLKTEQERLRDKTGRLAREIRRDEQPARGSGEPRETDDQPAKDESDRNRQAEGGGPGPRPDEDKGEPQRGGQGGSERPAQGPRQDGSQPPTQDQNSLPGRIEAAQARMREAQQKLDEAEREGAAQKQEEAIRELEQAKAELEEILRQLREEEVARMLVTLEARLKKMLLLQREVYDGTVELGKASEPDPEGAQRFTENPQGARTTKEIGHSGISGSRARGAAARSESLNPQIPKSPSSPPLTEGEPEPHIYDKARDLSHKEAQIVFEADKTLSVLRDDGTAVAFPEALRQARQDMLQASAPPRISPWWICWPS